jgi:hypothetical protein
MKFFNDFFSNFVELLSIIVKASLECLQFLCPGTYVKHEIINSRKVLLQPLTCKKLRKICKISKVSIYYNAVMHKAFIAFVRDNE